ncbi:MULTISPECIES: S10 family peptidase [Sphingomonas]|uniref:Peptidase S10 n=1 Tax=Sphingomonas lycopersici TaxID=2951807 RepID=A0AA41ZCF7_9SPHN|nr:MULTISPECIES: peptidase S10 [Sphingomonas]MCW6534354.1 peptidase S10 [Sphingomonas lycopersici]OJU17328.1 MAG: peptidase S10 [Sphingomonas sp. 66-10]
MFARAIAILLLSTSAVVAAQEAKPAEKGGKGAPQSNAELMKQEAEAAYANAPVQEREEKSKGSVAVAGRTLGYTATAGTLTIRDTEGKPTGSMFYTAYTLDGTRPGTKRPITFFYNGGPGSPTFWLHMGSFAPVRLRTGNPESIRPAPYDFGPNPDTLLDKTDLVFLDAMGAGYSRALGDTKPSQFYSVDGDVDAFARAIIRYVTKNGRWNSPKFIFGESYGTTRSGALAYQLQDRGMALNGVVLLSSIMNYGYRQPGLDQVYLNYLPSFAATAWYHNRIPNRPADVATIVEQARAFAVGPYASALAKGQSIGDAERDQIATQLSQLIGLSPEFIKRANLRIDLPRFQKELLRDQRRTIGRFDARYTGVDSDAAGDRPETDASSEAISGAFIGTFHDYVSNTLGYKTDMPYRLSARDGAGFDWNWKHKAPGSGFGTQQNNPNTAVDLAAAMRDNPYLQVLSMNGWYDMATPFFGTEYDLGHMMLEPAQAKNLSFTYYPAGHMTYLNPDALHAMKRDLSAWYDRALATGGSAAAR